MKSGIHKQHSSTTIKTNFLFLFLHSTFFCSTLLFIACLCRFHFWRKFLSWWRQQRIVFQFQLANIFSIHIKYRALSPFFRIQSEWKIKLFCYCLMARLMLCVDICMRRVWSFHSYFNKKRNRCDLKVTPWHQLKLKHNFIYKCVEYTFSSERKSTHPLAIVIWLGCKQKRVYKM